MNTIRRSALAVVIAGAATLAAFALMLVMTGENLKPAEYPNEFGFHGAIYWFELADSPAEIPRVLGEAGTPGGTHARRVLDVMNRFDFPFMAAYSVFFVLLVRFLASLPGAKPSLPLAAVAAAGVLMLAADAMENLQLLSLTGTVTEGAVVKLKAFTRVKWGLIFSFCGLAAWLYASLRSKFGAVMALFYGAITLAGVLSLAVFPLRFLIEYSGNLLGAAWLMSAIHAFIFYRKA